MVQIWLRSQRFTLYRQAFEFSGFGGPPRNPPRIYAAGAAYQKKSEVEDFEFPFVHIQNANRADFKAKCCNALTRKTPAYRRPHVEVHPNTDEDAASGCVKASHPPTIASQLPCPPLRRLSKPFLFSRTCAHTYAELQISSIGRCKIPRIIAPLSWRLLCLPAARPQPHRHTPTHPPTHTHTHMPTPTPKHTHTHIHAHTHPRAACMWSYRISNSFTHTCIGMWVVTFNSIHTQVWHVCGHTVLHVNTSIECG